GDRHVLAGPDVEWHPGPAPGTDLQAQRGVGFDLRVRRNAFFTAVAAELTANHIRCVQRRNGLEDLDPLIPNRLAVGPYRRLHREVSENLEEMILNHVAKRAGLLVESAAALHAEVLRHRQLHTLDMVAIPEGLEDAVGEAEEHHAVDRL